METIVVKDPLTGGYSVESEGITLGNFESFAAAKAAVNGTVEAVRIWRTAANIASSPSGELTIAYAGGFTRRLRMDGDGGVYQLSSWYDWETGGSRQGWLPCSMRGMTFSQLSSLARLEGWGLI